MRIRKHLTTSSIIPKAGLSDLRLLCRSAASAPSYQPSDHSTPIFSKNNTWAFLKQEKTEQKEELHENGTWEMEEKDMKSTNNDIRKIVSICRDGGERAANKIMPPSSSSTQEVYEVVPPKKRKGSFERNPSEELTCAKMKSKIKTKCGDHIINQNMQDNGKQAASKEVRYVADISMKKFKRGDVIMEGSRCSRVNGRGWRCHQPTMVGYSLCEHHLGKGRLRTVSGAHVLHDGGNEAGGEGAPPPSGSGGFNEEEEVELMVRKKRMKVGVKARSMSSLLSQV